MDVGDIDVDREERLARLEERVARLEAARAPSRSATSSVPAVDPDAFWALEGLQQRASDPGAVLYTGSVTLPTGERYGWQRGQGIDELLADDWSQAGAALTALAHPVRLLLLREVLGGPRTTAELGGHEQLGTTGQLYHHLRQLVSAGWLRTTARGQYAVPGERVVPLLVILAAAGQ